MSNNYVLEVAVFTVKEEFITKMPAIRDGLREALKDFPGLIELETYSPIDDNRTFADIAKWDTLKNAVAAAKAFESGDKRFLPYMETIEELKFMGHFKP
jgi:heme-degrading monooxygenase HmoA